jgi:hypothetical protein
LAWCSAGTHTILLWDSVLIDDREALAADWISKGGIFVHHTSTETTLQQLREHGILDDSEKLEELPIVSRPTKKAAPTSVSK